MGDSCSNHDLTPAWGPTYHSESPRSTSMASSLALARLWWQRHRCCTATGMRRDSDLTGSLWLGGNCYFGAAPWSCVGAGAGTVPAGHTGRATGQWSHSPCSTNKSQRGQGPGPEEIACQGLRRAAATRSPLAFSGTATTRRRNPPS